MLSIIDQPKFNTILPINWFANIFPLIGVIFYDWSFFLIVLIFWTEMLIITFFNDIKILFSQKINPTQIIPNESFAWYKFKTFFYYSLFRIFVFCFYLLFIVVFIGIINFKDSVNLNTFVNQYKYFNYAILNFFVFGVLDLLFNFFLNNAYKISEPTDHNSFFDSRTIITHVSIFIGAFLFPFLNNKIGLTTKTSTIIVVSAFILLKLIVENIGLKIARSSSTTPIA